MAISRISQGAVAAASDATPSVAEGDILIVFAYRSASATAPTRPAEFTEIDTVNNSGSGTNGSMRAGFRVAGAGGFSGTGTWTNASHLAWIVLRGQNKKANPTGGKATAGGNNASTSINYPAVTQTSGQSGRGWFVGFAGRTAGSATVATAPTDMTNHASAPATPLVAVHSSNGPRSGNWPSTTVALTGSKTCTLVVEVLDRDVLASGLSAGAATASASAIVESAGPTEILASGESQGISSASATAVRVKLGAASAAGTATAAAAAVRVRFGAAQAEGVATAEAAAVLVKLGSVEAAGTSTATAAGVRVRLAAGTSEGTSTADVQGVRVRLAAGASAGQSDAIADAVVEEPSEDILGAGTSAGSSTATASATRIRLAAAPTAGTATAQAAAIRVKSASASAAGSSSATASDGQVLASATASGTSSATASGEVQRLGPTVTLADGATYTRTRASGATGGQPIYGRFRTSRVDAGRLRAQFVQQGRPLSLRGATITVHCPDSARPALLRSLGATVVGSLVCPRTPGLRHQTKVRIQFGDGRVVWIPLE